MDRDGASARRLCARGDVRRVTGLASSQPRRIFTVTGILTASTAAATSRLSEKGFTHQRGPAEMPGDLLRRTTEVQIDQGRARRLRQPRARLQPTSWIPPDKLHDHQAEAPRLRRRGGLHPSRPCAKSVARHHLGREDSSRPCLQRPLGTKGLSHPSLGRSIRGPESSISPTRIFLPKLCTVISPAF